MKKNLFSVIVILFIKMSFSQTDCNNAWKTENEMKLIDVTIKNNYAIQFVIKEQKRYLKIIVKNDLGFNKKDLLQIDSGRKQYFEKDILLNQIDKTTGYFIFEINSNYTKTLKDFGITSIVFNNNEFSVPKQDSDAVKKAAACFYESFTQ